MISLKNVFHWNTFLLNKLKPLLPTREGLAHSRDCLVCMKHRIIMITSSRRKNGRAFPLDLLIIQWQSPSINQINLKIRKLLTYTNWRPIEGFPWSTMLFRWPYGQCFDVDSRFYRVSSDYPGQSESCLLSVRCLCIFFFCESSGNWHLLGHLATSKQHREYNIS